MNTWDRIIRVTFYLQRMFSKNQQITERKNRKPPNEKSINHRIKLEKDFFDGIVQNQGKNRGPIGHEKI